MPAKLPWGPVVSLDMNQELCSGQNGVICLLIQQSTAMRMGSSHLFDNVRELSVGHDGQPLPYGRMKNARDAATITAVAVQPQIAIDRDSVSR